MLSRSRLVARPLARATLRHATRMPRSHLRTTVGAFNGAPAALPTRMLQAPAQISSNHSVSAHALPTPQLSADEIDRILATLQASKPHGDLSTNEAARVRVFDQASPSVVFIATEMNGTRVGAGSGFVWDQNGTIVTNYHVVAGRSSRWWG